MPPNGNRKYEKPLHLDMEFDEALRRYGQTDPAEIPDNQKLRKAERAKRPAPHKTNAADPADE